MLDTSSGESVELRSAEPAEELRQLLERAEGALDHESFGRTKSPSFARRCIEVLNRSNPRTLRGGPNGRLNARWF